MSGTWTFYELQNKYEFHPHKLLAEVSFNRVYLVFLLFSYLPVHNKENPFLFVLLSFFRDPFHFSQTWTLLVNDLLSLHTIEGLQTLNDNWKVIKTQTCKSVHFKMSSQSQFFVWSLDSRALILLLGGNVPLPKGWLESAGPFLKQKGKHCLAASSLATFQQGFLVLAHKEALTLSEIARL